jgi:hypothetical protein
LYPRQFPQDAVGGAPNLIQPRTQILDVGGVDAAGLVGFPGVLVQI